MGMEFLISHTGSHYILLDGQHSLWIDRQTGTIEAKNGVVKDKESCLGAVYGFLGKLRVSNASEPRLVLIRERQFVCNLNGCDIYKIPSVVILPLGSEDELCLERCSKCQNENILPSTASDTEAIKPLGRVKVPPVALSNFRKCLKAEKIERRMIDEIHRMFVEADSFYYSHGYNLSNCFQKNYDISHDESKSGLPLWKNCDETFFWNQNMLNDLILQNESTMDHWIIPIIQGYIESQTCDLQEMYSQIAPEMMVRGDVTLTLISRRSRHRAGTRYLRRGVDEEGKVANYVETEQLISFKGHTISFVQTRGSVPVFWTQLGLRYRPLPKLERSEEENSAAFAKHFEQELNRHGPNFIVNLVEKMGKEKVLGDAFLEHIINFNSDKLTYITFDFHDHCKGMKFENIALLVEKLEETIRTISYCWVDSYGLVMKQNGVFRVNCIDCLDRTNVVQMNIAREVLCIQLSKLGLIIPEIGLPQEFKRVLQTIWANNGDTISKQYAGTNALKGDFTRTGERKISGMMKDGVNSANRYYLNRFKDASRQAAIELMLGLRKNVTEAEFNEQKPTEDKECSPEQIKMVIDDVKSRYVPEHETILGAWGLVDGKMNEIESVEVDVILILTANNFLLVEYDIEMEDPPDIQTIDLLSIQSIELGYEVVNHSTRFLPFSNNSNKSTTSVPYMKIIIKDSTQSQFHLFRSSNMQFFNNVVIRIQPEEMFETLKLIGETIKISSKSIGNDTITLIEPSETETEQSGNKPAIPNFASNLVHKYFKSQNASTEGTGTTVNEQPKKTPTAAFERFTPKYFRKSSIPSVLNPTSKEQTTEPQVREKNELNTQTVDSSIEPKDLVVPACGILAVHGPQLALQEPNVTKDESGQSIKNNASHAISISSSKDGKVYETEDIVEPQTLWTHHRQSLPTNSLDNHSSTDMEGDRQKSITPEITITEEELLQKPLESRKDENIATTCRELPGNKRLGGPGNLEGSAFTRLSRSTEDVHKGSSSSSKKDNKTGTVGMNIFGALSPGSTRKRIMGFNLNSLSPGQADIRSSSEEDIFSSMLQMKGSHSENALRDNNNAPQSPQKLFAPLGKIAKGVQNIGVNYLDPRKLRESFKQPRQDMYRREVDEELEERKKRCLTTFIDV